MSSNVSRHDPADERSQTVESPTDSVDAILQRQWQAWQRGQRPTIAELLQAISSPAVREEALIELAFQEINLRQQTGEHVTIDDYCRAYPHIADQLRLQIELDRLLDDAPDSAAAPALFPHTLGRYQLLEEVGKGGAAIVYQAWDPQLKRTVALKLLRGALTADAQELARFRREAEAIARIEHPGVVQIFDVGESGQGPFLTMEFCAGGTLAELLAQGPILPHLAAELVEQLAHALQAVHQVQILHRDLKPANVFLQRSASADEKGRGVVLAGEDTGRGGSTTPRLQASSSGTDSGSDAVAKSTWTPKISDFGLAKFLDRDDGQTHTGMIVGTPMYMAPEQALGRAHLVGPTVDVYALGTILYEALTGRPPFRGVTRAETLSQVTDLEPVPIQELQPRVPVDLATIAAKCLEKEPSRRYPSAEALAQDLRRFLDGKPISARRRSRLEVWWNTCRRHPLVSSLVVASCLLLICTISVLAVSRRQILQESQDKTTALTQRDQALQAREAALVETRRNEILARRRFYAVQLNLAWQAWRQGDAARAEDLLRTVSTGPDRDQFAGFEWDFLLSHLHSGLVHSFTIHRGEISSLAFSPDSQLLAVAGGDLNQGYCQIWDVHQGRLLQELTQDNEIINGVAFSPDGQWFATAAQGKLELWRTSTWQLEKSQTFAGTLKSIQWAPHGRLLVTGMQDGALTAWTVPDLAKENLPQAHTGPILRLKFSPDGSRLYSSADWGSEGMLTRQWNSQQAPLQKLLDIPGRSVVQAAWGEDQLTMATWGELVQTNLARDTIRAQRMVSSGPLAGVEPLPDRQAVLVAARTDRCVWKLATDDFSRLHSYPHTDTVSALGMSPDGKFWASGDANGQVRVWRTEHDLAPIRCVADEPLRAAFFLNATPSDELPQLRVAGPTSTWNWEPSDTELTRMPTVSGLRARSANQQTWVSVVPQDPAQPDGPARLEVWGPDLNKPRQHLEVPGPIYRNCLAISPSGRWLAVRLLNDPIWIYDLASETPRRVADFASYCYQFAFSPDERFFMVAQQYGFVRGWEVSTWQPIPDLAGFDSYWAWARHVEFSSDGKYLASGNESGVVTVWDFATRAVVARLVGHPGEIHDVAFFPDQRRIVVSSAGGVRLWDFQNALELLTLDSTEDRYYEFVEVDPTGSTVVGVTNDGQAVLWTVRAAETGQRATELP